MLFKRCKLSGSSRTISHLVEVIQEDGKEKIEHAIDPDDHRDDGEDRRDPGAVGQDHDRLHVDIPVVLSDDDEGAQHRLRV